MQINACITSLVSSPEDRVFKALADPTRRHLLDRLRQQDGRTLGELCEQLGMTRQSVTQHLAVLEEANLVSSVRRGREKLHHLNPVPLHEIQDRWIAAFERPRLAALAAVRRRAEEPMSDRPSYRYVIYIESTPERVWEALTDADLTASYWGHSNVSDWRPGSRWAHRRLDGSGVDDVVGTVVEAVPPRRLVTTWDDPPADPAAPDGEPAEQREPGEPGESTVTFEIEPFEGIVRLTVVHEHLRDDTALDEVGVGWPAVLSNLKSLLETGHVLPAVPWEMPRA